MKKFWNFCRNDAGERILRLEGPIDEESFWGDEITPQMFREELEAEEGDVTVWINSPGGSVLAAAEIYTMLCDHEGKVTVKIDAIAASAASVVAMAGDRVLMSPVAMLAIHDPMTIAMGNARDMEKAISTLNEVKESIINAYQRKTGLSRNKISQLMENETWMSAKKAVELGFADEILFSRGSGKPNGSEEEKSDGKEIEATWQPYSTRIMGKTILDRLGCSTEAPAAAAEISGNACGDAEDVEPPEAGVTGQTPEFSEVGGGTTRLESPVDETRKAKTGVGNPDPEDEPEEDTDDDPDENPDEDDGNGEDEDDKDPKKLPKPDDQKPDVPIIGMDGKTKDGAMPYQLLKQQLDFLK